jgi:hypothetical protein
VQVIGGGGRGNGNKRPENEAAYDQRFSLESIADDAGKRRSRRIYPHKGGPYYAKLDIGQPHLRLQ